MGVYYRQQISIRFVLKLDCMFISMKMPLFSPDTSFSVFSQVFPTQYFPDFLCCGLIWTLTLF